MFRINTSKENHCPESIGIFTFWKIAMLSSEPYEFLMLGTAGLSVPRPDSYLGHFCHPPKWETGWGGEGLKGGERGDSWALDTPGSLADNSPLQFTAATGSRSEHFFLQPRKLRLREVN